MSQAVSVPFTIRSPLVSGGILQLAGSSSGESTTLGLGGNAASQWSMQPAADGISVFISNQQSGSFISADPADWRIKSSSDQHAWYLYPVGPPFYAICYDPTCSMVWAPLSLVVNGVPGSSEVVLANAAGYEYEWWEVLQVGSASSSPPPTAPPVASTTNVGQTTAIQVYPRPSNTAPSAPPGNVQALAQCRPCGNTDCSFTPSGASTPATYSVLIGQPVANCNSGSQKDTTTKFGGKYELSTSFTVEVSAGLNGLGAIGPSFSTSVGKSEGKKIETAQEVEVTIEPGKIGALVANITYSTIPGRMDVGKSSLGFVAIQPELVLGYSVIYTDCGSDFRALALPKEECSQSSGAVATQTSFKNKAVPFWWLWLAAFILVL